jgi:DNA-binding transcriptional LysR family regulator
MDLNQLQAFDFVVRLGSISKAARYLDLSQPTVTLRIQGLEKKVGGPLFTRVGRTVELSELGKGFLPYARQAIDFLQKGVERVQSIRDGKIGHVTIGTLPTFTTGIFSSLIQKSHEQYPDIALEIHTGHNQQIIEMLYDGSVMLGFITHPYFNTDLNKYWIFREPLKLAAHYAHPLVKMMKNKTLSIIEVLPGSKPFILVDWNHESLQWQKAQLQPGTDYIELPPLTALDFLENGKGVALLTGDLIAKSDTIVEMEIVDSPQIIREIAVVGLVSADSLPTSYNTFLNLIK